MKYDTANSQLSTFSLMAAARHEWLLEWKTGHKWRKRFAGKVLGTTFFVVEYDDFDVLSAFCDFSLELHCMLGWSFQELSKVIQYCRPVSLGGLSTIFRSAIAFFPRRFFEIVHCFQKKSSHDLHNHSLLRRTIHHSAVALVAGSERSYFIVALIYLTWAYRATRSPYGVQKTVSVE